MKKPRPVIRLTTADIITKLVGILGLLLLIGLPIYFYNSLPDTILRHYGANGEPDGYSDNAIIWTLPVIGVIMYVGMFWLSRYPHVFNYPQEVTEDNAERLYTIGTRMMRTLNAIISCVFAYITYSTIQTSLGQQSGLGTWFTPIFMTLLFGAVGYYLFKSTSKKP